MALDAAALALCAKELSAALADARIDKIFEPTRDEVVLNLRTRTDNPRLFLSARSGSARACRTKETFENPQTPPSFCMLLRKHFTGGRLLEVRTLPDERILFFDFQCTNEMGDTVVNTMAAELMGRYSNLVLVQTKNPANPAAEGKIIDALKRVDFEDSEVRQLLPGLAYTLPPQPQKASFLGVSAAEKIVETAKRTGARVSGPVPLPTDKEVITILRAVHKYKDSREQFENRTHKRLIDILKPSNKTVEALTSLQLPAGVDIEIKL